MYWPFAFGKLEFIDKKGHIWEELPKPEKITSAQLGTAYRPVQKSPRSGALSSAEGSLRLKSNPMQELRQ